MAKVFAGKIKKKGQTDKDKENVLSESDNLFWIIVWSFK